MKFYLGILIGILFAVSGSVLAVTRLNKPHTPPAGQVAIKDTATSTEYVNQYTVETFDSDYSPQGACLKIKDSDGSGFTYLTVNNGVGLFSVISCE